MPFLSELITLAKLITKLITPAFHSFVTKLMGTFKALVNGDVPTVGNSNPLREGRVVTV
jgi:hypothetical protein